MALFYKPVQAKMPDKDGNQKWHLMLVKTGLIADTHKLSEEIAYSSTLTPADVHGVVRALFRVIRTELLNSNSVRLDGLGTFTMIAHTTGNGVDTAEEVNPGQISTLRVHFTPEYTRPAGNGTTRAITQGVQYVRADKINSGYEGGNTGNGNGDGDGDDGFVDPIG